MDQNRQDVGFCHNAAASSHAKCEKARLLPLQLPTIVKAICEKGADYQERKHMRAMLSIVGSKCFFSRKSCRIALTRRLQAYHHIRFYAVNRILFKVGLTNSAKRYRC
jgi:hypothetical protein